MFRFLLIFSLSVFLFSCQGSAQQEFKLQPAAFEEKLAEKDVQVLDVRTAGEFRSGYIQNAMQANWVDRAEFNDRTRHLDKNKTVLVYCASGIRSAEAAELLREQGYTVFELVGGMNKWKREGKPVAGAANISQMSLDDYQKMVSQPGWILVDFGAAWCPPCRKMEPVLAALEQELPGKFQLQKVDGGVHTNVMKTMKVDALPHFFIYKDGKQVWQKQGIVSLEELKAALQ